MVGVVGNSMSAGVYCWHENTVAGGTDHLWLPISCRPSGRLAEECRDACLPTTAIELASEWGRRSRVCRIRGLRLRVTEPSDFMPLYAICHVGYVPATYHHNVNSHMLSWRATKTPYEIIAVVWVWLIQRIMCQKYETLTRWVELSWARFNISSNTL